MEQRGEHKRILGRFDLIHIIFAIIAVVFVILSIIFIILFATKHDTSTGFLATGYTLNGENDLTNNLRGLLSKKYTINSFGLEISNNQVTVVFSLRDSISASDVQNTLSGSEMVSQLEVTYGDKGYSVCHQRSFESTTVQTSTAITPSNSWYCDGLNVRDVLIVVDINSFQKTNQTEKIKSLSTLSDTISNRLNFDNANVFLAAIIGDTIQNFTTTFTNSSRDFHTNFQTLLATSNTTTKASVNIDLVLSYAIDVFVLARKYTPKQLIIVSDKPKQYSDGVIENNPRDRGVFVAVIGIYENYMKQFENEVDMTHASGSWNEMAIEDPFAEILCTYYNAPPTQLSYEKMDLISNSSKCEQVDIVLAFDTSESLSRIILAQYKNFAKELVSKYKFNGDDNARIGVISFNSNTKQVLSLTGGSSQEIVDAHIDEIEYTGGFTDVPGALNYANDIFTNQSTRVNAGRVLVVMTDGITSIGNFSDEIAAGQKLAENNVATFFIGFSSYTDDIRKDLGEVTKPDYIFNDTTQSTIDGVTGKVLIAYPCPVPKCVTGYYAIELSEATIPYQVDTLQNILKIADLSAQLQTGTETYQLITYSEEATNFNPRDNATLENFKQFVQNLIDDESARMKLNGNTTRLDSSINDIASEIEYQLKHNPRFSADIIIFGQANDAVLDPDVPTDQKRAQLKQAVSNLQSQTELIYVADQSRNAQLFGQDLWKSVISEKNLVEYGDDVISKLKNTDYFTQWSQLTCELPLLKTCSDVQLDIALILDLNQDDYPFLSYIQSFINQFSTNFDCHVSVVAYGVQNTMVLSSLNEYNTSQLNSTFFKYDIWKNGSLFTLTTLSPTTTYTTVLPTSKADISHSANTLYTIDAKKITEVFDVLSSEFGCGHYNDNGDRFYAPNVYIFASNNFQNYDSSVWDQFTTENKNRYGCNDCGAAPSYIFLSRTETSETIGVNYQLTDADLVIDPMDDDTTQASINKFNSIVSEVCSTPLPKCTSYSTTCNV